MRELVPLLLDYSLVAHPSIVVADVFSKLPPVPDFTSIYILLKLSFCIIVFCLLNIGVRMVSLMLHCLSKTKKIPPERHYLGSLLYRLSPLTKQHIRHGHAANI